MVRVSSHEVEGYTFPEEAFAPVPAASVAKIEAD